MAGGQSPRQRPRGIRPGRGPGRAVARSARHAWHDLRLSSLYRSGKEFGLMDRALGFAALAILTVRQSALPRATASPGGWSTAWA
jgi:hypothetical protein